MLLNEYGNLVYAIVFLIIFAETGLVVTPFLPGDSLLFALGMLAARRELNFGILALLLFLAAVLGDTVNYSVGRFFSDRATHWKLFGKTLVKAEYLQKTHNFFERHGPKTIFLARFVPIVRTFSPFVAGAGKMPYKIFSFWNLCGALSWVLPFLSAGYFLGNIPIIKNNFEIVVLLIIFVSLVPMLWSYLWARTEGRRQKTEGRK